MEYRNIQSNFSWTDTIFCANFSSRAHKSYTKLLTEFFPDCRTVSAFIWAASFANSQKYTPSNIGPMEVTRMEGDFILSTPQMRRNISRNSWTFYCSPFAFCVAWNGRLISTNRALFGRLLNPMKSDSAILVDCSASRTVSSGADNRLVSQFYGIRLEIWWLLLLVTCTS